MKVFLHHIYEYKKRLRRMVLHTAPSVYKERIAQKLRTLDIGYLITKVNEKKINVFFGDTDCIQVIRSFGEPDLSKLTDEQDFILGTLLGYDISGQCKRYIKRRNSSDSATPDNVIEFPLSQSLPENLNACI
ncbi:MAG: DUF2023 family protein [Chitinispirillaceae bacterium]|nr:DUF2023 family protein [Chitinispirillaceae bacterium]